MPITPEQKQELHNLAKNIKFQVSARGPKITLSSKCATAIFANNGTGYEEAKAYLQKIARPQPPYTAMHGGKPVFTNFGTIEQIKARLAGTAGDDE